MRRTGDRHLWLAAVLAVVGLLLAVLEVAIWMAHPPLTNKADVAATELWQYVTQGSALVIAGLILLARRVAPTVGWLLLGPAVASMAAACLSTWLRFATTVTPAVEAAVYAEYVLWQPLRIALPILPLCLPYGRLPRGPARLLAATITAAFLLHEIGNLFTLRDWHPGRAAMPNALYRPAVEPFVLAAKPVLELVISALVVLAAVSPFLSWRRFNGVQRRQVVIVVPVFLLLILEEMLRQAQTWSHGVAVAKIALGVLGPAALAYTVMRDRLYDLDRAARRVIGVAVPLVLLAAVYGLAAAVMVALPAAGAALPAVLAVLAALAGLVLRPAARWVQRRVDRLLYGNRAEPYLLARQLARSLRDGADTAQVPLAVCQIVVSALRLPGAALDADTATGPRRLAAVGVSTGLAPIELRYQGRTVGRLLVAPRSGEAALDELDLAAVQPLADLAAPAVSAILLAAELESSRARVVEAREEERDRLRRDVHDGVGPSLAAIRLQLDTAAALLPAGSPGGTLLARAADELGAVVSEIRRVTENLRPAILDERGLLAALAELAGRLSTPDLPVRAGLPAALPPVPAPVELAAYRIAAEATANAVRHAAADEIWIRLAVADGDLLLEVSDDGIGPAPGARPGVGLASMARRAADIGGACTVTGGPGGTVVTARLPRDPALIGL